MHVWTIANQKGGVGKTTTTVALGGICAEQGERVLLIDMDPHGSLSSYFGLNPDTIERSCFTLFQQRKQISPELVNSCVVQTSYKNISILPSSIAVATLERQGVGQDGMGLVISRSLAAVRDQYDRVLIDCPPLLGVLMINALAACEHLIVPVQTEFLALKGLERMIHTMGMMARSLKKELPYTVLPTMYDRRTQASVSCLRLMRNTYSDRVWPGKIPIDTKFRDASKAGVPPSLYAPESRGIEAYGSLLKWLSNQQQEAQAV